jgi:hypothetical protein
VKILRSLFQLGYLATIINTAWLGLFAALIYAKPTTIIVGFNILVNKHPVRMLVYCDIAIKGAVK